MTGKDLVDVASGVDEDELEALTPILGNAPPILDTSQPIEVRNNKCSQKLFMYTSYCEILSFCFFFCFDF